jgi:mono/diheme cytochrome c family protein
MGTKSGSRIGRTSINRLALAVVLALAGSGAAAAPPGPVERGAYLAAAAGCDQCHTNTQNHGRPYAGGRVLATSFGTVVTPNITPDPETGIGRWRFADFERALRWGIAPDDSHYLPAFPFPFYNRLAAADLADLAAFFKTVAPVRQVNRPSHANFFAALRGAVAVVASRFPGPWRPDPEKDAVWNRGAYLVAGIGRCGDCHTPRSWLGAPEPRRALSGAPASGARKAVPNITPDPKSGIGRWSEADIETLLKEGMTPDSDFVGGAMAEEVRNTTRLSDADRHAIAVYLRTVPPVPGNDEKR